MFIFIYLFWLCWVFVAACRLSLTADGLGSSLVAACGLLIVVAPSVERGLWVHRLQESWLAGP